MSSDAFVTAADAFLGALPTFATEANALQTDVNAKQVSASNSATNSLTYSNNSSASAAEAAASAQSANGAAGAAKWVSGTTYAEGDVRWSPSNYLSYRRKTAGSGTTDPANDPTNWAQIQTDYCAAINPKALSQGVALTASASVGGISVADNANLDLGTGNFTLHWEGSLPDWTPSAEQTLLSKTESSAKRLAFTIDTVGRPYVYIARNTTGIAYISTAAMSRVDGTIGKLTAVVVRETASSDGSVTFYTNGVQLGASVTIPFATTTNAGGSLDNTSALVVNGLDTLATLRYAGTVNSTLIYNRALSAGEVLSLYNNGVAESDKDGSQTNLAVNGTFTGSATGRTVGAGWAYGTDNIVATASSGDIYQSTLTIGKKYRVTFEITAYTSGQVRFACGTTGTGTYRSAVGIYTEEVVCSGNTNLYLGGNAFSGTIDNVSYVQIGTTLRLEPEGIKLGKWYDASSNNLDASYPASGFSFTRKMSAVASIQPAATVLTASAMLTIAQLLTGQLEDTHATGATATYTLPTATLMDAALPSMGVNDFFLWSFINLSAAAADTCTIAAGTNHTIVGSAVIQSQHATTGALYGASAVFRTRKSAVNTYITTRIS
jgi:hypothetical protein